MRTAAVPWRPQRPVVARSGLRNRWRSLTAIRRRNRLRRHSQCLSSPRILSVRTAVDTSLPQPATPFHLPVIRCSLTRFRWRQHSRESRPPILQQQQPETHPRGSTIPALAGIRPIHRAILMWCRVMRSRTQAGMGHLREFVQSATLSRNQVSRLDIHCVIRSDWAVADPEQDVCPARGKERSRCFAE